MICLVVLKWKDYLYYFSSFFTAVAASTSCFDRQSVASLAPLAVLHLAFLCSIQSLCCNFSGFRGGEWSRWRIHRLSGWISSSLEPPLLEVEMPEPLGQRCLCTNVSPSPMQIWFFSMARSDVVGFHLVEIQLCLSQAIGGFRLPIFAQPWIRSPSPLVHELVPV